MVETTQLTVLRYRDAAGKPTCACDFLKGDVCSYYRTQRFGTHETCAFASTGDGHYLQPLQRRGTDGTLIPGDWCPVWNGKEQT